MARSSTPTTKLLFWPTILLLILPGLLCAQDESREDEWYAGIGLGVISSSTGVRTFAASFQTLKTEDSTFGGYGTIGYRFSENLAGELRIGTAGTGSHEFDLNQFLPVASTTFTAESSVDYFASSLLRGEIPLNEGFSLYGLVGVTRFETTLSFPNFLGISADLPMIGNSLSYGVGADFAVTDELTVGLEAIRYSGGTESLLREQSSLDGTSVTAKYRF